jgi:hypothetical protein
MLYIYSPESGFTVSDYMLGKTGTLTTGGATDFTVDPDGTKSGRGAAGASSTSSGLTIGAGSKHADGAAAVSSTSSVFTVSGALRGFFGSASFSNISSSFTVYRALSTSPARRGSVSATDATGRVAVSSSGRSNIEVLP